MNRHSWSQQEDTAIRALVAQHGIEDWTKISDRLKEEYKHIQRSGKQCRERWHNHLSPQVNKLPWSIQEQNELFRLHREHGNRWKDISLNLKGRTDNDIKNHFYSTLRRSLRRLKKILGQKNSTSQMRQIKPMVLSTIMGAIYQGEQATTTRTIQQDQNIRNQPKWQEESIDCSLKELPLLIFEFAKFKPIKDSIQTERINEIKETIMGVFNLISKFNLQHQSSKSRQTKGKQNPKFKNVSKGENEERQINPLNHSSLTQLNTAQQDQQLGQKHKQEDIPQGQEEADGQKKEEQRKEELQVIGDHKMSLQAEEDGFDEMCPFQEPSSLPGKQDIFGDLVIIGQKIQPRVQQGYCPAEEQIDQILEMNYD